jgi:hypothetical protein
VVTEETCYLSRTRETGVWLELSILPLNHLLAKQGPRVDVDGEDDKDLELRESSKRRFV